MRRTSIVEYFEVFRRRGAETAYAHRRGYRVIRWSYRELAETACQFARELKDRGIRSGDRVLLWGENCAEWVVAFWGCALRGIISVPMDPGASVDFARRVAQQASVRLQVSSQDLAPLDAALPVIHFETLRETVAKHSPAPYDSPPLRREDPVEIVFTSGTTAEPKGVVLSHGNILANLEPFETEIGKYRKLERLFHPLRFLNLVPLSHVFGQFMGLLIPQLLGGTVVFHDALNPSEILRAIRRERVSVLAAVPRLLDSLKGKIERDAEAAREIERFRKELRAEESRGFFHHWWRFRRIHRQFGWKFWALVSGGAALDSETETFWRRLGFAVLQGYGLTETTSLVSVNHPFKAGKGSIGKTLPGLEVKLDETGQILVRGENIARGYWQGSNLKPLAGVAEKNDRWFETGDLGGFDAEGNLYFKGRKKDVIITPEGMNVFPEDLESVLRGQPGVTECVVVGAARGGNAEPCAVLILRDGAGDPGAIVRKANESLAGYQQMRRWVVWPEGDFPRTSTLKPRTKVIQEFVDTQLSIESPAQSTTRGAPDDPLAELIARVTGRQPRHLSPNANLEKDLNLNSIERVELLGAIEDRFQMDLNESKFAAATTVSELEQMLRQPLPRRSDYIYPRWAQRWPITWIRLAVYYLLTWPATLLLGYPRIRGRENLRGVKGPILIVCNHITSIDVGFVLAALPPALRHRLAVAMDGERLEGMRRTPEDTGLVMRCLNKLGYALVVALFNVFPLPQSTGFRESFAYAGESVDRGYNVLVFPEGRRTDDGKMASFRAGIGLLAQGLTIPVLAVRIEGLFELKRAGKRVARPGAVRVTLGAPMNLPPGDDPVLIPRELESRVAALAETKTNSIRQ